MCPCPGNTCSLLSPALTCRTFPVAPIISVVMYSCIVSRNCVSKHTYFLLLVLLLWPGWPGIAQLCQVFPPSVAWGAWACREADENAEPERREDLPARCQGMCIKFLCLPDPDSKCEFSTQWLLISGEVYANGEIWRACLLCHLSFTDTPALPSDIWVKR